VSIVEGFSLVKQMDCPNCGAPNNGIDEVGGDAEEATAGDFLVCAACSWIGVLDEDEQSLHEMTQEEFASLDRTIQGNIATAVIVTSMMRQDRV
jgi:hypothetical protein